ncbi:zinc metalloprotease HtpX [Syntrophorhabdus aromaticivorans]|uniref:Protease HtpX homolog n=1 Tax=Syntrophorhabdus aromaticivorans TaxID=328301 RepID=A0A971M156_9BACT|nr:zinc metalloprotease HtpX [Syntrophorhabdus aromaticivorans]NLW33988.1 zinc metalloprotease HtpX [Syntrophorhabdus aromaticivorans]
MNHAKTFLLMAVLTIIFVALGSMMGGKSGAMIAFLVALVMNLVSYWFSDKIVLKMYGAQEVSESDAPQLYAIVSSLSQKAGIPMPRVFVIENDSPNAFATGRNPANGVVAVTTGITRILSRDELEGVLAHEISHIKHRDILVQTVAATLAGAITMIANWARFAAFFGGSSSDDDNGGGNIFSVIIFSMLAAFAAMLIQLAISRSREYLADDGGAQLAGNPLYLAGALRKLNAGVARSPMNDANPSTAPLFIVNPFTARGVLALFSTHPPIEERIRRLEDMAYKR